MIKNFFWIKSSIENYFSYMAGYFMLLVFKIKSYFYQLSKQILFIL